MKETSAKFTIPTEYLSLFSKKLYPLAKTGNSGILTMIAHRDYVQVRFQAEVDVSGISGYFEYLFSDNVIIDCPGIVSVSATDFADMLTKFPHYKNNPNKPHTKQITFVSTQKALKVKTTIYWNELATPTEQELILPTVKRGEDDMNPLDDSSLDDGLVTFENEEFISAIDMCSFIRGDVTSKDEYGYKIYSEGSGVVMMATDLQVAARYVISPLEGKGKLEGVAGRQVLNSIRTYMHGAGILQVKTTPKQIYIKAADRRMTAPLLKRDFPIDSEIFFEEVQELGTVEIDALTHVINHFLSVDKDPFHNTTFEFDNTASTFRIFTRSGKNNVDNLPATINDSGFFDADALSFNSILPRLKKISDRCRIHLNSEGREIILLMAEGSEARYLIQAINRQNYDDQQKPISEEV